MFIFLFQSCTFDFQLTGLFDFPHPIQKTAGALPNQQIHTLMNVNPAKLKLLYHSYKYSS